VDVQFVATQYNAGSSSEWHAAAVPARLRGGDFSEPAISVAEVLHITCGYAYSMLMVRLLRYRR
jgi:hypothetical protein